MAHRGAGLRGTEFPNEIRALARYVVAGQGMIVSATALAAVCFAFGTVACGKVDGSGEGGSGGGSTFESAVPPYVAGDAPDAAVPRCR